jgi:hypothetical protein
VGAAQGGTVVKEGGDRRVRLVLVGLGRHREPRVVGQQRDDGVGVAALDGVGEPLTSWRSRGESGSGARSRPPAGMRA